MDILARQREAKVKTIEMLESNYERLGRPPCDYKSSSFWQFMSILVDTWQIAYPLEVVEWLDTREFDMATEKTCSEQVSAGLHKSFAIPSSLFHLIRVYWPMIEFTNKDFGNGFKKHFPIFKNSKY